MEITWHGNQCFKFKGKKASLIINPQPDATNSSADIVLNGPGGIDWPGEYEIKEVAIAVFQAWTSGKSGEEKGEKGEETLIFYFKIDGIKFCHLGGLGHVLTSEMVNKIGDVDVLFIDAGTNSNLSAKKALEVIEAIEPKALIPMGEGSFSALLKELGAPDVATEQKITLKSAADLPIDKRSYFLLEKV